MLRSFVLILLTSLLGCKPVTQNTPKASTSADQPPAAITQANDSPEGSKVLSADQEVSPDLPAMEAGDKTIKGALLATRFKSFEALKKVIRIEYLTVIPSADAVMNKKDLVRVTHSSGGREVTSILTSGISEGDFRQARDGGFWDRVWLALNSPYTVLHKGDLMRVYYLSRRMYKVFGEGDAAFYDLAETMMYHISDDDLAFTRSEDLSEKGFINTFNHVTAQAFMTSIFSESLADFIADAHERDRMPELITGKFTGAQLMDLENGPLDNYVDIINNEWGQELGKRLKKKHKIHRNTVWTPELLVNYLNDVQSYFSWSFQIGFKPYRVADEVIIRFSDKLNRVMKDLSGVQ